MSASSLDRHNTALPNSDVRELVTQHNLGQYWVLNSAIALSTATYSSSAFQVLVSGVVRRFTAATGGGFTGITVGTGRFCYVAAAVTSTGATHSVYAGTSAASIGACALPTTVPATSYVYGLIQIGTAGAASAFTGGTTVLDGTNASAVFFNLAGPAGIACQTAPINTLPG